MYFTSPVYFLVPYAQIHPRILHITTTLPHNLSPPLSFPLDHIRHQTKARYEASRSSPLVHRPWMGEEVREISPWPDRVCRYGSS